MSDAMISSIANFGAEVQSGTGNTRYQLSVASPVNDIPVLISQMNDKGAGLAVGQHLEEAPPLSAKNVAVLSIRRFYRESEYANSELDQPESNISYDLFSPPVREWFLPLMAIGLGLSL